MDAPWDAAEGSEAVASGYRKLIFLIPPADDTLSALDRVAALAADIRERAGA